MAAVGCCRLLLPVWRARLQGSLPAQFSGLASLLFLSLSSNKITVGVPPVVPLPGRPVTGGVPA